MTKRCGKCGEVKPLDQFSLCTSAKDGRQFRCKICDAEVQKQRRNANPDRVKAYNKIYYEINSARECERVAKRRSKDPEATRELGRRDAKRWRNRHPEEFRASMDLNRARRKAGRVDGIKVSRKAIAERDNWICHLCKKKVKPDQFSLDHLIPISRGGIHSPENLATAHRTCNNRRGADHMPAQLRIIG